MCQDNSENELQCKARACLCTPVPPLIAFGVAVPKPAPPCCFAAAAPPVFEAGAVLLASGALGSARSRARALSRHRICSTVGFRCWLANNDENKMKCLMLRLDKCRRVIMHVNQEESGAGSHIHGHLTFESFLLSGWALEKKKEKW